MSHPTVYVLGASGRAAAASVRRAGYRAVVIDLYADRDAGEMEETISILKFPDSIIDQMRSLPTGWILLAGGMEHYPTIVNQLSQYHRILGPHAEQLARLRNIRLWNSSINDFGDERLLRFPETRFFESTCIDEHGESSHIQAQTIGTKSNEVDSNSSITSGYLKKSFRGAGGFHVHPCSIAELLDPKWDRRNYLQELIQGESIGVTFICHADSSEILGVTASVTRESYQALCENESLGQIANNDSLVATVARGWEFQVQPPSGEDGNRDHYGYLGSYGPIELPKPTRDAMVSWMHRVANQIGYQGLLQADWIVDRSGVAWLLEINPRWTAGMEVIEWSRHASLFELHASHYPEFPRCIERPTHLPLQDLATHLQTLPNCVLVKLICYAAVPTQITEAISDQMMQNAFRGLKEITGMTVVSTVVTTVVSPRSLECHLNANVLPEASANGSREVGWGDIPRPGTMIETGHPIATWLFTTPKNSIPKECRQDGPLRINSDSPGSIPFERPYE